MTTAVASDASVTKPNGVTNRPETMATTITSDASVTKPTGVANGSEGSVLQLQLLHDPGVTADWTAEEQTILDDGLTKYVTFSSYYRSFYGYKILKLELKGKAQSEGGLWVLEKELGLVCIPNNFAINGCAVSFLHTTYMMEIVIRGSLYGFFSSYLIRFMLFLHLSRFASETANLSKYIKIAALLPEKTVRDVAMRCRWMTVL
jgi:hypothetical protein